MVESQSMYHRHFSGKLKREIVQQMDRGRLKVREVCQLYDVSHAAVYKWLDKYSNHRKQKTRLVVEKDSTSSKLKAQQARIKELESALGRKQMRIDYLEKLIEISEEDLQIDIEKKSERLPLSGSEETKRNSPGK